eukprot:TRINITY_DN92241_c0_g1_i1.p1 TRINITY_DN92241_c0_g1~~TRINITY_DN92241_c0_g1_i1.p1  ORF type:complete len:283 (-),score=77.51 TRINITY_DN92241_c0_g1_i1:15-863(-)
MSDEENDLRLDATVNNLLAKTFEEALQDFPALRDYIHSHMTPEDLHEEFRACWSLAAPEDGGAPPELRQVLKELLDPALAAKQADALAAFQRDPTSALLAHPQEPLRQMEGSVSSSLAGGETGLLRDCEAAVQSFLGALDVGQDGQDAESGMRDEEVEGCINRRLQLPLQKALEEWPELRAYIDASEDGLLDEFAAHWSVHAAPETLRQVLRELLDPAIAERAAVEHAAFIERISSVLRQGDVTPVSSSPAIAQSARPSAVECPGTLAGSGKAPQQQQRARL